ncbi:MAG TPA: hypothetical protein VF491_09625 [Vicinamibacterales bacterium]|jgi:hypothetical protein
MSRWFTAALATAAVVAVLQPSTSAQRVTKRVFVGAADEVGDPVLDLTARDFHVTENGAPREVTRAALCTAPMRIVLLVDSSTAIQPMMVTFRNALNAFADTLPPVHEVTFITSGGQIRVRTQPSTDRAKLKESVGLLAAEGGANAFLDTMLEADERFLKSAPDRWPVFVILTTDISDARREPDVAKYNKFMNDFLSRGGNAHAVIMEGKRFGPVTDLAHNLVQNTDGMYTQLVADSGLPDRLVAIARRLANDHESMLNRYELEFAGDPRAVQSTVAVSVSREGVEVEMSPRRPF